MTKSVSARRGSVAKWAGALVALVLAMGAIQATAPVAVPGAVAADGAGFDPGLIISDATFYNDSAMNENEIRSFLQTQGSSCFPVSGRVPCLKDYTESTPNKNPDSYCNGYSGATNEPSYVIIAKVARSCHINPQVLLTLLEKEQSIVSTASPTSYRYRSATGYGCPDTALCDAEYYGFFNQVFNAARAFQRYTVNSSSQGYQPGRVNTILNNPNPGCGTQSVFIQNQATANLYIYTPYVPNQAALNNLYGAGDGCSSYGNRNFWRIFTDWFGAPGNLLTASSFEGGSLFGWTQSNGFINRTTYNDAQFSPPDGQWFAATNTAVSGRAMTQDVRRSVRVGEEYTYSMWVRSSSATQEFSGLAVLWGLGGSSEKREVSFTVGSEWKEVKVSLPIRASAHDAIRLDVYLLTVGATLFIDKTSLFAGQAPALQNLLINPSFEGSFGGWIPGNGFMNRQIYQVPSQVKDGEWFAAANAPAPGRSFAQDVSISGNTYDRYTFTIWLRSSDVNVPFDGLIVLWGLGGPVVSHTESKFSVGGEWTKVTQTIELAGPTSGLRAELYMNTVGPSLWLDGGQLTKNLLSAPSFEGGSFSGWKAGNGPINYAVYQSPTSIYTSYDGSFFAASNTATVGASLVQDVSIRPAAGDTYTAEVWLRSSDSSVPFSGTFALWALGGQAEATSVPFTVGPDWTKFTLTLPITQDKHSSFRFEIYMDTVNATLFVDAAAIN